MRAKFFGVGVGPGDPELLTLKAVKVLNAAAVVCVPQSRPGHPSLALNIARQHISSRAEVIEVLLPMSTERQELKQAWEKVAGQIAAYLEAGKDTAFITLGDPSLYSTFSYVHKAVARIIPDIEVEVIPGITAFAAAAATVRRPLAAGDAPLIIDPGGSREFSQAALKGCGNVVMMKVSRNYGFLLDELEKSGRLKSSFLTSRCSLPEEVITEDLLSLKESKIDYLSLIISKPKEEEGN